MRASPSNDRNPLPTPGSRWLRRRKRDNDSEPAEFVPIIVDTVTEVPGADHEIAYHAEATGRRATMRYRKGFEYQSKIQSVPPPVEAPVEGISNAPIILDPVARENRLIASMEAGTAALVANTVATRELIGLLRQKLFVS